MKPLKYIVVRLLGLLLVAAVAQIIHQRWVYPSIKKSEGWLQAMVERRLEKKSNFLYFSASTNTAFAPDDSITLSISDLLQQNIQQAVNVIDTSAIHGGIFLKILQKIPENQFPKTIVMDLNLRSFGANWIHSDLENSLQRNFVYWNERPSLLNHLFAATKWYDYKSPNEHLRAIEYQQKFERLPFNHPTIKKWCDSLFQTVNYSEDGKTMIEHFGFHIQSDNQQLKNFEAIVALAKSHESKLILVLLPENVEKMKLLVDQQLPALIEKNAEFLTNHFKKMGVLVIDLHAKLPKESFFEAFPTEHYNAFGRQIVATAIAGKLPKK
ncbi:MAG: hypothetical protein V4638_03255 [Bacteroidota bacterium]